MILWFLIIWVKIERLTHMCLETKLKTRQERCGIKHIFRVTSLYVSTSCRLMTQKWNTCSAHVLIKTQAPRLSRNTKSCHLKSRIVGLPGWRVCGGLFTSSPAVLRAYMFWIGMHFAWKLAGLFTMRQSSEILNTFHLAWYNFIAHQVHRHTH